MTTDVYGLGAVLYFLLTNRPPFEGDSFIELGNAIQHESPKRPSLDCPEMSRDLETICLKCLSKEQTNRYATVTALLEDIDRFQKGLPIAARPVSSAERLAYWVKRNPKIACLWGTIVLLMVGWSVSQFISLKNSRQRFTDLRSRISELTELGDQELTAANLRAQQRLLELITQMYADLADTDALKDDILHNSALAWFQLGRTHNHLGNMAEKDECYLEAETRFRQLIKRSPAICNINLICTTAWTAGNNSTEALEVIERIAKSNRNVNKHYRAALLNAYHKKSMELTKSGDYAQALNFTERASVLAKEFYANEAEEPRYRRSLGTNLYDRAEAGWLAGNTEEALLDLDRSLEITREILNLEPNDLGLIRTCLRGFALRSAPPFTNMMRTERGS